MAEHENSDSVIQQSDPDIDLAWREVLADDERG
jgi:hypothetical protein